MDSFVTMNTSFDKWSEQRMPYVVRQDRATKQKNMRDDEFLFMRATFFAWTKRFLELFPDLFKDMEIVLSTGDLHPGNYGTWLDQRGRLSWGINDVDEAHFLPYIFDLVRLATGTKLAIEQNKLSIKPFDAYEAIIEGYAKMLKLGGRGFVLEEDHLKLGLMARHKLKDRCLFWQKLDRDVTACSTKKWLDGFNVLISQLPPGKTEYRIGQRTIGQGSLGRPRLVAIADHDGGLIAHEVKVCLPSSVVWAGVCQSEELHYNAILDLSFRSKDPFLGETNKVVHRRLSPSCSRVELSDLPRDRDEHLLLGCMGAEAANIHLGTPDKDVAQTVLEDLRKRGGARYLKQCVKVMLAAVRTDHEEWVQYYDKLQRAKAVRR